MGVWDYNGSNSGGEVKGCVRWNVCLLIKKREFFFLKLLVNSVWGGEFVRGNVICFGF